MKLLLLDLDGTVRQSKSNPGSFIEDPEDQELIAGAAATIALYHSQGWKIVGISNEGRAAGDCKSLEQCIEEQRYTLSLVPQLQSIYCCTDYEGKLCWMVPQKRFGKFPYYQACHFYNPAGGSSFSGAQELVGQFRKPSPGMLLLAMQVNRCQPEDCLCVGDREEDYYTSTSAGIKRFHWAHAWRKEGEELTALKDQRAPVPETMLASSLFRIIQEMN